MFIHYKTMYSRKIRKRNSVGVIVDEEIKERVAEVVRKSDKAIMVILNIVSGMVG